MLQLLDMARCIHVCTSELQASSYSVWYQHAWQKVTTVIFSTITDYYYIHTVLQHIIYPNCIAIGTAFNIVAFSTKSEVLVIFLIQEKQ